MHTAIFGVATIFVYIGTTLLMHGEQPSVGISFELLFAMFILNMKDIYRGWLFNQFVSIFAILLALCLVEFVLSSYFGISYIRGGEIYRFEGNYHYYYQGLLNIFPHYYSTGIARFQAFTEEPGLVGTLCAFLVATTEFRTHKWQVVVFVMSGVLSLSLAFYILFSVWGMFQLMMLRKFKYSILIGFVFSAFVFVFYSEFSDSIVNRIDQISYQEIDNRTTEEFETAYQDMIRSDNAFFGVGLRNYVSKFGQGTGNAGVKPFIYSYGFVSLAIIALCIYLVFFRVNEKSYKSMVVLLILFLSIYQRVNWTAPYYIITLFAFGAYDKFLLQHSENNSCKKIQGGSKSCE